MLSERAGLAFGWLILMGVLGTFFWTYVDPRALGGLVNLLPLGVAIVFCVPLGFLTGRWI